MADVNRPPSRRGSASARASGPGRDSDRGQLFLVGALSLAVLFVGLALLLNTAIYTENLATRNTDPGTDPSISYRTAAVDAGRELMIKENRNGTDPTWEENTERYESAVEGWSENAALHTARRARFTSLTVESTNGTRFEQTNASHPFVNKTDATDWTLGDRSAVRDAHLTVQQDSLPETNVTNALGLTGGTDPFAMEFDTPSGDWHVYVFDDDDTPGDDVTVLVEDPGGADQQCSHTGPAAAIDVTNGSINGTACSAFDLLDLPDTDVDNKDVLLSFENGDQAGGTYEIKVASGADITDNVYDNEADGDGASFVTAIIYEADLTITYESTDVYYQTTIRVAPEELR